MKKNLKRFITFFLAALMICATITTVFAESVFSEDGYLYTYINNEKVTLYSVEGINDVVVPATLNGRAVVEIRNYAFMSNADITSVDFRNALNLERIGAFAFYYCENLDGEVNIPSNVLTIDSAAFQGCTSLDSVVFNASTGIVPNQCFSGCATLSSVTLNDTVTEIGYYAFANCPNLAYLEIPATVERISGTAFSNDTITLGVYYNSPAYLYAMENGIDYEILDPQNVPTEPVTEPVTQPETTQSVEVTFVLGDADGDGFITILDATKVQRVLADLDDDTDGMITLRAAVDGDVLNIMHATKIQRYLAEFDVAEPIGEEVTRTVTI